MGGPVANCLGGGMHMQTCKHEDIKKTKKAKVKILWTTGSEPKISRTRIKYYYQLGYVTICQDLNIREWMP